MYKFREDRQRQERRNPSFSSTLLDEIYRSTDDGRVARKSSPDLRFYRETLNAKQSKTNSCRTNKQDLEAEQMSSLGRACLIDKYCVEKKADVKQRKLSNQYERKFHLDRDQDVMFFSSTSSSSESSSGGFSSSDTDSLYGSRSVSSCFVPHRPKTARTTTTTTRVAAKKTERSKTESELHVFDDYHHRHHYNSVTPNPKLDETDLIKSKSRALKIYNNLKKVKQPISPGGRLATFINSLFNKTKNNPVGSVNPSYEDEVLNSDVARSSKSVGQVSVSACSSASSYSRSCLSKNPPSSRQRLRDGVKRSVRFYPVSVIVDEDCRPCGHKCLYDEEEEEEEEEASLMSVSKAREILKKSDVVMRDHVQVQYDEDDDAASDSSSDLFELDHLNVIGSSNTRYCEELPVYETTHVRTNRAIANGLII